MYTKNYSTLASNSTLPSHKISAVNLVKTTTIQHLYLSFNFIMEKICVLIFSVAIFSSNGEDFLFTVLALLSSALE